MPLALLLLASEYFVLHRNFFIFTTEWNRFLFMEH